MSVLSHWQPYADYKIKHDTFQRDVVVCDFEYTSADQKWIKIADEILSTLKKKLQLVSCVVNKTILNL